MDVEARIAAMTTDELKNIAFWASPDFAVLIHGELDRRWEAAQASLPQVEWRGGDFRHHLQNHYDAYGPDFGNG